MMTGAVMMIEQGWESPRWVDSANGRSSEVNVDGLRFGVTKQIHCGDKYYGYCYGCGYYCYGCGYRISPSDGVCDLGDDIAVAKQRWLATLRKRAELLLAACGREPVTMFPGWRDDAPSRVAVASNGDFCVLLDTMGPVGDIVREGFSSADWNMRPGVWVMDAIAVHDELTGNDIEYECTRPMTADEAERFLKHGSVWEDEARWVKGQAND
jgi:hypothetical protein